MYLARVRFGILMLLAILAFAPGDAARADSILDRVGDALRDVPADRIPTGILIDRAVPLSHLDEHDGSADARATDLSQWRQLYDEMTRGAVSRPDWPDFRSIDSHARSGDGSPAAPIQIVVLDFLYDRIRSDAIDRGALVIRGSRVELGPGDAFESRRAFAATPVRGYTYHGAEVRFRLNLDGFYGNSGERPSAIDVDFGDGRGFVPIDVEGSSIVRYSDTGQKMIRVRCRFADGSLRVASSPFEVRALLAPAPSQTLHVTATIPYLGGFASGDAYIYLSDQNTTLTHPVVMIEGFDPDNTMNWDELYALLNRQQLLENLRSRGFDAVVLNFADGGDYIQRNAFLTVELIEQLRSMIGPTQTMAVVGASMGGLVGRYALTYMEAHAMPHSVRSFISFDSPQGGADIPLGIQYWLWFFAELSSDAAANLASLDTPAARQMLVYHHTDPPGGGGASDPLRGTLLNEFAAMGDYPTELRKVAIANGSGDRWSQGFAAGAQIIRWEYTSFLVDLTGNCWAVPNMTSHDVFHGLIDYIWAPADEVWVTIAGTRPYDNAPGGWRDTMAQLGASDPGYGDIVALYPNHCFIPTVSALALDTTDLFYDVAGDGDILSHTPFDAVYFPADNQEHVDITVENAAWFVAEIERGVSGVAEASLARGSAVIESVSPNPSDAETRIRYRAPVAGPARLEIYDTAGRRVAVLLDGDPGVGERVAVWDGVAADGARASTGIYFARLRGPGYATSAKLTRYGSDGDPGGGPAGGGGRR